MWELTLGGAASGGALNTCQWTYQVGVAPPPPPTASEHGSDVRKAGLWEEVPEISTNLDSEISTNLEAPGALWLWFKSGREGTGKERKGERTTTIKT